MRKTVDGLCLCEKNVGENDKLLTVLTANEGRIFLVAKGARSMKSKALPLCRLFTYANFEYYEKNDRRWVAGGSVNESFFGLNRDIEGFALASYVVQVASEITDEGVEAEDILRVTLNTLYAIEKKKAPYEQIKAAYEWFAAMVSGFMPDLDACSLCGEENPRELWLDVMNGCLVCKDCQSRRSGEMPIAETDIYETRNILLPLDGSALAAMRYVRDAEPSRLFAFGLNDVESMRLFCHAAEVYLLNHLERDFDTLSFYRTVKE